MEQLELSYSMINSWRTCHKMYYYKFVEKIEPKKMPKPLEMGAAIHSMIESYRKGKDWTLQLEALKATYAKLLEEEREYYGDIPKQVEQIVRGYIQHYDEEDKGLVYHLIEEKVGPIPLVPGVIFSGRPDGLAEDTMGRLLLVEVKTGKRLPNDDFRIWNLQTLIYIWALRKKGYKVSGVLWDHIRTKVPTEPRLLKDGTMSKRELDTTYETYYNALVANHLNPKHYEDILSDLKKRKAFYTRYRLPVKSIMVDKIMRDVENTAIEIVEATEENRFTMDISTMKCPRCMFKSICHADLLGGDPEFVKTQEFCPSSYGNKEEEEPEDEETGN